MGPLRPVHPVSTTDCTKKQTERSLSSETSSPVFTPVKLCQKTSKKSSLTGAKKWSVTTKFWSKDSTMSTSEATATVCQECTAEDHVSVCHVPHQPNSDFAVSVLSRPTGTTAVTETSRPVLKNKLLEVSSLTNSTSTKST